mgnify:CR=1 FL=1
MWRIMSTFATGSAELTPETIKVLETVAKSAARTIGSTVGREIIRGVLGSLLGGSRRR